MNRGPEVVIFSPQFQSTDITLVAMGFTLPNGPAWFRRSGFTILNLELK
jgi:hypothetical protein